MAVRDDSMLNCCLKHLFLSPFDAQRAALLAGIQPAVDYFPFFFGHWHSPSGSDVKLWPIESHHPKRAARLGTPGRHLAAEPPESVFASAIRCERAWPTSESAGVFSNSLCQYSIACL